MRTWWQMPFPTYWGRREAQQEVEESWCKRISCNVEGVYTIGLCISRFLSEKVYPTWTWKIGIETHRQILWGYPIKKNRERKGPSRGIIQKCALHERSPSAPKFEEISHEETLFQERCARKAAWVLAKNVYKLKNSDKTTFYTAVEKGMPAPTSKRPEEGEFVVDSGASTHMMSEKELSSEEMGTVKRSYSGVDCWWRSAHSRGGTSVRSWLELVRNRATTRGNAISPIARQALRKPRILQWVVQWSKATMGRVIFARQTISYLLLFQGSPPILEAVRPPHRNHRNRWEKKQPSLWKQSCIEVIFSSSHQETGAGIPENPKPK